jgi:7,8-dihydro-6-hydroxymethylpterin-pyrophosphokinase
VTETPNPYIRDADTMTGEMRPIRQAVLALGSNLGERFNTLQGAINALADTPEVKVVSVSPVYESPAMDAPEGSRIADDPDLVLPHPRVHERAFVLRPWLDIEPEAYVPGQGLAVDLIEKTDQSTLKRRDDLELEL